LPDGQDFTYTGRRSLAISPAGIDVVYSATPGIWIRPLGMGRWHTARNCSRGGKWVLFTLLPAGVGSWDQAQIVAQSLRTGERIGLVDGGRDARYLPSGHLIYGLRGDLFGIAFDAEKSA
jgi:hypothetical protein